MFQYDSKLATFANIKKYMIIRDQHSIIKTSIKGGLTSMLVISVFDIILQVMFPNIAVSAISNILLLFYMEFY